MAFFHLRLQGFGKNPARQGLDQTVLSEQLILGDSVQIPLVEDTIDGILFSFVSLDPVLLLPLYSIFPFIQTMLYPHSLSVWLGSNN